MAKRQKTKRQTIVDIKQHRKLKIEQQETPQKRIDNKYKAPIS